MSENLIWLRRVWWHHRREDADTGFWQCVRASIALLLDRHDECIYEDYRESEAVAYKNLGIYETDYGTGYAFEALHCRGFSFAVIQDGTL